MSRSQYSLVLIMSFSWLVRSRLQHYQQQNIHSRLLCFPSANCCASQASHSRVIPQLGQANTAWFHPASTVHAKLS